MDSENSFLSLVVILLVLFIGGAIVIIGGNAVSSTTYDIYANITANTSTNLGNQIQHVNYVNRLITNSSLNATSLSSIPSNHSLLTSNPSSLNSNVVIDHQANIESMNIGVYVNGNLVGTLSNNTTDTFPYSQTLTSVTVVEFR